MSAYNFEQADTARLFARVRRLRARLPRGSSSSGLTLPAYEQVMKGSHAFNLLDARRAISVTERQRYILRVRAMARAGRRGLLPEPRGARLSPARRTRATAMAECEAAAGRDRHRGAAAEGARLSSRAPSAESIAAGPARRGARVRAGACPRHAATPRRPDRGRASCASRIASASGAGRPLKVAFDASGKPTRAALAFAESMRRRRSKRSGARRRRRARGSRHRATEAGQATAALLPGIVERAARGAARSEAHALGQRRRRVRAARPLARAAARRDRGAGARARPRCRPHDARPPLPRAAAARPRARARVRRRARASAAACSPISRERRARIEAGVREAAAAIGGEAQHRARLCSTRSRR